MIVHRWTHERDVELSIDERSQLRRDRQGFRLHLDTALLSIEGAEKGRDIGLIRAVPDPDSQAPRVDECLLQSHAKSSLFADRFLAVSRALRRSHPKIGRRLNPLRDHPSLTWVARAMKHALLSLAPWIARKNCCGR